MEVSIDRSTFPWLSGLGILLLVLPLLSPVQAQGSGGVEGFVGFSDEYPPRQKLNITQDPAVCGHTIQDEAFVVDPETKGLANAVIFWELPAGQELPSSESGPTVLSQEGCRYEPHVQVAGAGSTTLQVLNKDGILHNVHAYDEDERTLFNFAQPGFKKQIEKELPRSRVINIQCDVHEWMSAYVLVLDRAIYAITDEAGCFRLEGLPPGQQRIRIWHEGLGASSKSVTVEPGQWAELDFVIGQ